VKEEIFTHKRIKELKHISIKRFGMNAKEIKRLNNIQRMVDLRLEHEQKIKKRDDDI